MARRSARDPKPINIDETEIAFLLQVRLEHFDLDAMGRPNRVGKSFQSAEVACDQNEVVAPLGEAKPMYP